MFVPPLVKQSAVKDASAGKEATVKEVLDDYQIEENGLIRLGRIIVTLTMGWPLYLFFNVSGRKYERWANHFDPYSPIFSKRERLEILISDAALILVVTGLTGLAQSFGWLWLLKVNANAFTSKFEKQEGLFIFLRA